MDKEKLPQIGFAICIVGLLVALLSAVPSVVPPGNFPWPIFVGSMIYFPGAFLAFFFSRGKNRNQMFNQLRFIRLGFIAVIVFIITMIMRS